ncbi:MAG TPA: YajQ family cyclic di-GMP-binding protein [Gammaproteobacteria bacterium]|nr:YajQ family cyclic di-GMP-binding protein [Gammaproteobacteria bacterium]
MPSFDVVSELDQHELANAVDQASREIANRFDFKGTGAKFELADFAITLEAPSDFQLRQLLDILTQKLAGRHIDLAAMDPQEPEVTLSKSRQTVLMKHGVDSEHARKIVKLVKESKLKLQAAIQGEQVRVTGKKRDDLQEAIRMMKSAKLDLPLQFMNFRD